MDLTMPSAAGERHMLPRHTNRILYFFTVSEEAEGLSPSCFSLCLCASVVNGFSFFVHCAGGEMASPDGEGVMPCN
jgi:hypothetical protein